MPKCESCDSDYIEGALYCQECGAYLLADSEREIETTVQISTSEPLNGKQSTRPIDGRTGFGDQPERILFMISTSGRRIAKELSNQIRIGRSDPGKEIFPELDLTADEGFECGVSRRHALIQASENGIALVDLGSTNGTLVNRQQVNPERPFPLSNGDHIQLGGLILQIFFEK